ncbi:MAG: EAL domain-containing protein [Rhodospirillales bacterium]|nr:EAL domain-containing protein [Rhodospirillales bacterium]
MSADANTGSSQTPSLRAERDRFVALASCWADILVELDADATVTFAAGPTAALMGRAPEALIGVPVLELIAEPDRTLVGALLGVARRHGRIENASVRLAGRRGPTAPFAFAGYRLDEFGRHYFLAFRMGSKRAETESRLGLKRDEKSGLFDAESFAEVVGDRVRAGAESGEQNQLTLIELPAYKELHDRLDEGARETLLNTFGTFLKASSVDGDTAARIADDRYGLVHAADVDVKELESKIADFAREADPEGRGAEVETATVEVEGDGISDEDLANGLVYAINRFRSTEGRGFSIKQLSTNISALVSTATESVNSFKRVVAEADFAVALQPIIDVMTGEIHHFEALARFESQNGGASPYETIMFAEETGLIQEFDLAMAQKVVEWLGKTPRNSTTSLAVNVSGHSVGSAPYMSGLQKLLADNLWLRGRLMFEITESARMTDLGAADNFIQSLRTEGYTVCLDDFGAGAANFQYLSTMVVDIVKLDGSAVRNAQKAQKGRAFLKALVGLCRDLGVETIAEMVDDRAGLEFIRDCGVQYVQGYLFGKPSADVRVFRDSRPPNMFPAWRGR